MSDLQTLQLPIIAASVVTENGTTYALAEIEGQKKLVVVGDVTGFEGEVYQKPDVVLCSLTAGNAQRLRQCLPWLKPVPLGLQTSAGFGDRMGVATPGHVQAVRGTGVAAIFAQQSVRENTRTGRTPQGVVDDAMWSLFSVGWREPWGADADHMKNVDDIAPFVQAGYSFYTIDPSDHVDDAAQTDELATLQAKVEKLPWDTLQSSPQDTRQRYLKTFDLKTHTLTFDEPILLRAMAKYGAAIAHTVRMVEQIRAQRGGQNFDLEMSVDETGTATSLYEHFYIAAELKRLGVTFVSLAPRFVGRFEKGVDYIGDLGELEQNIAGHAAIIGYFDNGYKLSLHTGSDKFTVYPIADRYMQGRVHLKTAGTSYLEALRLVAAVDAPLFRTILDFSRGRYDNDRKTYHVSALLEKVAEAASLTDAQLPDLLNQFDARQVLHVTFGSVLDTFGDQLRRILREHEAEYQAYIKTHFDKHLAPFRVG
ncbi:MAG TPA: tagaturonate epimerase family protein [Phototrophicaceae bacterium]|nr:tagaturonate epimerase family protein [Phototrophicaceae bacterium]